ncbi:proteasome alpha 1 subunit, putative [Bodo saltans]|uniref:Proteasome subunit alpha type n=1 Tax=Bodo saltans TaxID=75058 RepID=A0A0S4IWG0_BODSA|nr:proteasome alpha 1 subunit, putative [Bodo saltans]|eukprot:CUG06205.1 proteasome alpha 1 subunit, putative [Bodo saltans]
MFRNQYDTDITTWSPAGRLYQVEYAMEAVNQGSAAVGAKNKDFVVLAALKRSPNAELSSFQEKVFKLDDHMGMAITGLVADGRKLARFIRTEANNHRYMQDSSIPVNRIAELLGEKHQRHIQSAAYRPYGVGLLIGGYDRQGPHLFQTSPSGDVYDFKATAMGVRSQAARTYLEKHFQSFPDTTLDELVLHALRALGSTAPEGVELNIRNTTIAIVGKDTPFAIFSDEGARKYLDGFKMRPEDLAAAEVEEESDNDDGNGERPMDLDE